MNNASLTFKPADQGMILPRKHSRFDILNLQKCCGRLVYLKNSIYFFLSCVYRVARMAGPLAQVQGLHHKMFLRWWSFAWGYAPPVCDDILNVDGNTRNIRFDGELKQ